MSLLPLNYVPRCSSALWADSGVLEMLRRDQTWGFWLTRDKEYDKLVAF